MKRSEYVKLVNDLAGDEMKYLEGRIGDRKSSSQIEEIANLIGLLYSELPSMSARIAATIIEKSGLIQFDPENDESPAAQPE